jgi:hypothetical protein
MSAEYEIGLAPVTNEAATGVAKEILDTTQAGLGFVPNMYRAMATSAPMRTATTSFAKTPASRRLNRNWCFW